MTDKTKAFLKELAELLTKYGAEIEGLEETVGYYSYCDGVEFTVKGDIDYEYVKLGRYIDAKEVLKAIEEA